LKGTRRPISLAEQFPHLRSEQPTKSGWVAPLLTLGAVALVFVLSVAISRVPAYDFTRPIDRPDVIVTEDGFELIGWSELVPATWNPSQQIQALRDQGRTMDDADPATRARYRQMREVLDAAPAEPALEGRKVRIAGYVVPLDARGQGLSEFLLVPYFGACIHSPAPPANQVIHVVAAGPAVQGLRTMDAVWVRGALSVVRHDAAVAASGYRLAAASTERYEEPARRP
jgi:hypothetical protein